MPDETPPEVLEQLRRAIEEQERASRELAEEIARLAREDQ